MAPARGRTVVGKEPGIVRAKCASLARPYVSWQAFLLETNDAADLASFRPLPNLWRSAWKRAYDRTA
jgi:hypothetical protein